MKLLTSFVPGEIVPVSGQYWVVHLGHRLPYQAFLKKNEHFPVCKRCSDAVVYEYASELQYVGVDLSHDEDFMRRPAEVWAL